MVRFEKVAEKFEDKGISLSILLLNLPSVPIFDPTSIELCGNSREDLSKRFFESNRWRLDHYREKLEELDVWIDYQKHE